MTPTEALRARLTQWLANEQRGCMVSFDELALIVAALSQPQIAREPTQAMIKAFLREWRNNSTGIVAIWRAMHDAAKHESKSDAVPTEVRRVATGDGELAGAASDPTPASDGLVRQIDAWLAVPFPSSGTHDRDLLRRARDEIVRLTNAIRYREITSSQRIADLERELKAMTRERNRISELHAESRHEIDQMHAAAAAREGNAK